jgi:hypothetical protein
VNLLRSSLTFSRYLKAVIWLILSKALLVRSRFLTFGMVLFDRSLRVVTTAADRSKVVRLGSLLLANTSILLPLAERVTRLGQSKSFRFVIWLKLRFRLVRELTLLLANSCSLF